MNQASRCQGRNRAGERCQRAASRSGYCTVHDPEQGQNMKALGRVGGLAKPRTKLRERADDDLREQARQTLSAALAGKDVPKSALDAARSLFAYSPAKAPSEAPAEHPDYPKTANGRRVIGLADVLELALEHEGTKGIFANARMADVVKRCAAQVEEFEREGRIYGASDGNEAA